MSMDSLRLFVDDIDRPDRERRNLYGYGVLYWYENTSRSFTDKVKYLADQYEKKMGQKPTCCYICDRFREEGEVENIEIEAKKWIQPDNYLLGM